MKYEVRFFTLDEFRCKCGCDRVHIASGLVFLLDLMRAQMNSPLVITSGFRCQEHNKTVSKAINSRHTRGLAADVACPKTHTFTMFINAATPFFKWPGCEWLKYPDRGFMHLAIPGGNEKYWDGGPIYV